MQKKLKFAENCKIHTLIKTKNFFAAMCGVIVLAGATIANYTAVTKSQKEMSDLTRQNLELMITAGEMGADDYTNIMDLVCKTLGCCGGEKTCYKGEIKYKGFSFSSTFYKE